MSSVRASAERPDTVRGILLMLATVLCFVCLDTLSKQLVAIYPVGQVVWARYTVHFLIMFVLLAPSMRFALIRTRHLKLQLTRAVLLLICTASFFTALRYLPMADAVSIGFLSPLLVTVLSIPMLKEKVGVRRWIAVLVGFCGMLIIVRPGAGVMHWAVIFPLITAVGYAIYQIITRMLSGKENPFTTLFYTAVVGAAVATAALPLFWVTPTPLHWLMLIGTGVFGGVGHFMMIKALELAPASALAPISYTQLIWATLFGYLFFGDFPDGWTMVGAAIIVGAGVFVFYREQQLARRGG